MAKAGPIVGLVGGTIMLITNFIQIQSLYSSLQYGYMYYRPVIPVIINILITATWAVLGIIGAVFSFQDRRVGNILMLIAGAGAMVGTFIPISIYNIDSFGIGFIFLNVSFWYIDCTLILIGGILGMTLKPRQ